MRIFWARQALTKIVADMPPTSNFNVCEDLHRRLVCLEQYGPDPAPNMVNIDLNNYKII